MDSLMRAFDWSKTPLGPVETWPGSLKAAVRAMLTPRVPEDEENRRAEALAEPDRPRVRREDAEKPLRGEQRQAFLLKLSDSLRAQPGEDAVEDLAVTLLAEQMRLDRCYITAFNPEANHWEVRREFRRPDLPPMPEVLRPEDHPEARRLIAEQTLIYDNSAVHPGLTDIDRESLKTMGFGAVLAPVLRKGEGNPVWAIVAVSSTPRHWTDAEVALVEEVAERTWAAWEHAGAERAMRDSEKEFRTVVETAGEGIVIAEPDGRLIYVNPRMARMLGYAPGEMLGKLSSDFAFEDKLPLISRIRQDLHSGETIQGEFQYRRRDGSSLWTLFNASPIYNDRGEHIGNLGMHTDITERKKAEDALRASEQRYRALFDSIDEGFCIVEVLFDDADKPLDYRFLSVNSAFEQQTGLHDPVGRTMKEMVPGHEPHWFETYGRIVLTNKSERFEARADALGHWYDVFAFPLGFLGGRQVGVLFKDISQRRESEQRRTFLLSLSDALRPMADSEEIQATGCRLLGERLGVDRAYYVEVDEAEDLATVHQDYLRGGSPSLSGTHQVADFGWVIPPMRRGDTLVVPDVAGSPLVPAADRPAMEAVRIAAHINAPLVKAGSLVGALCVTEPAPRAWTATEVDLVRETGERIWAAVERAKAEAALRESERKYRTLFDSMAEGFAVVEIVRDDHGRPADYRHLELNQAFEKHSGLPRDRLLGKRQGEVFTRADLEPWLRTFAQVADTGRPASTEGHLQALNRWYEVSAYPRDGDRVSVFYRDVTPRKQAEEALRAGERRLRRIIEGATDYAIVELDLDGNITYWNSGAERLMGWSEAEILGQSGATFFSPEAREKGEPEKEMEKARATGRAENERWHIRKDGSRFWGGGLVMPLTDGDGKSPGPVTGFIKIFQDRTERRRLEESLRDQAQRLRDADRRKDEFLAMLAHELRNPLAAISNAAQVAKRSSSPDHRQWSQDVIESQVKNLSRMIDDLLDVSRITRGKIQVRKQFLDLSPIIASAVEATRPLLEERNHHLVLDLAPGPLSVEGDPTRLEQVLVNLLNNAAKYTEPGGQVTLSARKKNQDAVIAVEDTGIGMSPELLARAFDLFSQGDRTSARSEGGLGVGLTLVKSLVSMHGGTIQAESPGAGQGSRFTIRLPLAKGQAARPEKGRNPADDNVAESSKVLVVDDNEDTARGMARLLKILGHDVLTAHDGPSAIEQARAHNPDTILLDIGLPGMDGYQVARSLRDQGFAHTLIIAVSGYGEASARAQGRQAGFNHHLVKPVDFDSLAAILGRSR